MPEEGQVEKDRSIVDSTVDAININDPEKFNAVAGDPQHRKEIGKICWGIDLFYRLLTEGLPD